MHLAPTLSSELKKKRGSIDHASRFAEEYSRRKKAHWDERRGESSEGWLLNSADSEPSSIAHASERPRGSVCFWAKRSAAASCLLAGKEGRADLAAQLITAEEELAGARAALAAAEARVAELEGADCRCRVPVRRLGSLAGVTTICAGTIHQPSAAANLKRIGPVGASGSRVRHNVPAGGGADWGATGAEHGARAQRGLEQQQAYGTCAGGRAVAGGGALAGRHARRARGGCQNQRGGAPQPAPRYGPLSAPCAARRIE